MTPPIGRPVLKGRTKLEIYQRDGGEEEANKWERSTECFGKESWQFI